MAIDDRASGLSVTLEPRRPGATWVREIETSLSGTLLVAGATGSIPPVDRVDRSGEGTVFLSGPATERLGVAAAGSWRGLSHTAAPGDRATSDRAASGFTHLVFAATPRDEVRALGWAQRLSTESTTDTGVHIQSTWERRAVGQTGWRVFGGYTERHRTAPAPRVLVADSLETDPVSDLMDPGGGRARRWTLGARLAPSAPLAPVLGIELDGARHGVTPTPIAEIRELVDGRPARVWQVNPGVGTDVRHLTTVAAYANERVTFGRLTAEAGLRVETMRGAAEGAERGVRWTSWLPRAMLRWDIMEFAGLSVTASYRRSAFQLPLSFLAVANPAAPVADISRWDGTSVGPLVARVGPGTGGDEAFIRIDPRVERPITDELVVALESRPSEGLLFYLRRVTKRERSLLRLAETAINPSEYDTFDVPDPFYSAISVFESPLVTVYNRPPNGYGRDRYVLTNRTDDEARAWAIEFGARTSTDRFDLFITGLFSWAKGPAAAVGFLATQNDQDLLGSLFVDPNSTQHERGQLFLDRSHVAKAAAVVRLPWRSRLGVVARYQDGQPFGRVLVVPNPVQGPTAIRAYRNGGSAFTYTGTLDVRLQKIFTSGRMEVAAILDVYNLPGLGKEVSEYIVTSPAYRTPTALQPPRTAVVGARVTF